MWSALQVKFNVYAVLRLGKEPQRRVLFVVLTIEDTFIFLSIRVRCVV